MKCGPNAECVATRHTGQCKCKSGYIGNASGDKGCRLREISCTLKNDCPSDKYCHKGICKGKLMFMKNRSNIEIIINNYIEESRNWFKFMYIICTIMMNNLIISDLCLLDEECESTEKCTNGKCLNPCKTEKACGLNAECSTQNHIKQCSCSYGFTGNQDVECVRSKYCY